MKKAKTNFHNCENLMIIIEGQTSKKNQTDFASALESLSFAKVILNNALKFAHDAALEDIKKIDECKNISQAECDVSALKIEYNNAIKNFVHAKNAFRKACITNVALEHTRHVLDDAEIYKNHVNDSYIISHVLLVHAYAELFQIKR